MAPRNRKAVLPKDGPADSSHTQQSRSRAQTKTGALQDEDLFNLNAISGGEDNYEPVDHDGDADPTAGRGDIRIQLNDPDAVPMPKSTASDIHYFFKKTKQSIVCKVCK